jgi:UDP-glucose 4-epimerase
VGELACNLGTGTGYSVREVIETARRVTGHSIPAVTTARRPGDPPRLVAAAGGAEEQLGWRPARPDLEDIIRDAWSYMQSNPDGFR